MNIIVQPEQHYKATVVRMVKMWSVCGFNITAVGAEYDLFTYYQVIIENDDCFVEIVAWCVVNCGLFKI